MAVGAIDPYRHRSASPLSFALVNHMACGTAWCLHQLIQLFAVHIAICLAQCLRIVLFIHFFIAVQ